MPTQEKAFVASRIYDRLVEREIGRFQ